MEALHHELWIVQIVNGLFGPLVAAMLAPLGFEFAPGVKVIPDHIVMCGVIVVALCALSVLVRSRLSVENPGRLQIIVEDGITFLRNLLHDFMGHKGERYLPLVGGIGLFIWIGNLMGLIPGFMSPTSSINVTVGCALTVFVYYHIQGFREQGVWPYLKHFAAPPGAPVWMAPIMLPIELISHVSRVLSLSLRLFGNIFGEDLVILILFTIVPFFVPLPMMFLALVTSTLQAFIFVMLTTIYLSGAVATEEHH
jgi:F-type H+-transporting ATPase subunit a